VTGDKTGFRIGILTLSDKGAAGARVDESGPVLREMAAELGAVACYEILPDDQEQIAHLLASWADSRKLDLILTTGGTGMSPRDVTPEATRAIIEREVPGIAEAMRLESLKKTPHAMLSRGIAGIRGETLIINLPGSPRAARENFAVTIPALKHGLAKLAGDPADCAT
jgi:molybdenum cofactor synthesis domain-containing protein